MVTVTDVGIGRFQSLCHVHQAQEFSYCGKTRAFAALHIHSSRRVWRVAACPGEAVTLIQGPLPDIGWKAWGMERRGVKTVAGDLSRAAHERLEVVQGMVAELAQGLWRLAPR